MLKVIVKRKSEGEQGAGVLILPMGERYYKYEEVKMAGRRRRER